MTMSFNRKALGAFWKLGVVALITATLAVCLTACKQTGGASLILSPDHLTIRVRANTADNSAVTVEGCTETTLKSDVETELHAKGTTVIPKGKIAALNCQGNRLTELNLQGLTALRGLVCRDNQLTAFNVQGCTALQGVDCSGNKLTSLNVQGLTALKELTCYSNKLTELNVQGLTALRWLNCFDNQLNAQAMTKLLNALPSRTVGDDATVILYTEKTGVTEGNCKDYSNPEDLKKAFEGAKKRNWTLMKLNASEDFTDI